MNNKNLRSRRNINKYDNGKNSTQLGGSIGDIAGNAFGFLGSAIGDFQSPSLQYAPATIQQNGPISYDRTNNVNSGLEMKTLGNQNTMNTISSATQGAALGTAIMPGIGTAIGAAGGLITGLLGGASRKRKLADLINKRNTQINATNNFNQSSALSTNEQLNYAQKYGNNTDSNLFNTGKSPMINKFGNSLVGKGETIVNGNSGNTTEVTGGSAVGTDDVAANIAPQDAVLGNLLNPFSGRTFAEDAKPLTRMEKKLNRNIDRNSSIIAQNTAKMVHKFTDPMKNMLIQQQSAVHNMSNGNKYDGGKSPYVDLDEVAVRPTGYVNPLRAYNWFNREKPTNFGNNSNLSLGTIPNLSIDAPTQPKSWLSGALSTVSELGNKYGNNITNAANTMLDISPILYNLTKGSQRADTVTPDQLVTNNPYGNYIMNTMANRKYNVNPELSQLNNLTRRNMYNSRQLGSEAGVNRYLDIANTANMLDMMSNIYGKQQSANNQYAGELANTMNSLGEQYSARNSAAKNAAYEINQRNLGAKNNYNSAAYSQLSEWNQGRKKTALENEWMNKYFNLYRKQ
jgi:hypothetical protein